MVYGVPVWWRTIYRCIASDKTLSILACEVFSQAFNLELNVNNSKYFPNSAHCPSLAHMVKGCKKFLNTLYISQLFVLDLKSTSSCLATSSKLLGLLTLKKVHKYSYKKSGHIV